METETITIAGDSFDIPTEAAQAMRDAVGRFPAYKGNVAAWVADWVKGTLISLAQQDHTASFETAQAEITAMFKAKPKPKP